MNRLDKLSELELKNVSLAFDGAEEMNFWIMTNNGIYQLSIPEARKVKKFLDFWLNRVDKVKEKNE
uniref:Uncharacterized protein n=1 Tax=viral metagenome TaxID=1070528 RepID=A0A6M3KVK1_9ZZZZ